jgi:hypothetical protein
MLKLSLIRIAEVLENKLTQSGTNHMRSAFKIQLLEGLQKKLENKKSEASP